MIRAILPLLLAVGLGSFLAAVEAPPWEELQTASRLALSDPPGARAALEDLVLRHPDFAAARYNLGTLLIASDPAAAAEHLEQATGNPGLGLASDAWHNLALARFHQGRLAEALTAAEEALRRRPEEADYLTTRDELRRALVAQEDALRRQREAEAARLRIPEQALPPAWEKEAYTATVTAAGGTAPYRLASADLPKGLALSASGVLTGSPDTGTAGTHKPTVTVTDAASASASGTIPLTILPAPAITTPSLPEAILAATYAAEITTIGLLPGTWTAEGLPSGLTLTPQGERATISGTPAHEGRYQVSLTVEDGHHRVQRTYDLTVDKGFAPAASVLPPATAFAPYHHRLTVRGPPGTYRWRQDQQSHGLAVREDGTVTGSPDQAGEVALELTILAEDGRQRSGRLTVPVNPPPVIEEETSLSLVRGQAQNQRLRHSGGTPAFAWQGSGGPLGIRIDPDGVLRGAASENGTSALLVTLTDRWQATTQATITVTVSDPPDQQQDQQPDQAEQDQQPSPEGDQQPPKDQSKPEPDQPQHADQQPKPGGNRPDGQPGKPQDDAPRPPEPEPTADQQASADPKPQQGDAAETKPAADGKEPGKPGDTAAEVGMAPDPRAAAADRWMDQLPPEDREVLRLQLLYGQPPPAQGKDPW